MFFLLSTFYVLWLVTNCAISMPSTQVVYVVACKHMYIPTAMFPNILVTTATDWGKILLRGKKILQTAHLLKFKMPIRQ